MSKWRKDARTDNNQSGIIEQLEALDGVTVAPNRDDFEVGYRGKNYWIELKNPERTLDKDGRITKGCFKKSQIDRLRDWKGQYDVAWSFEDCLDIIGYEI